MCQLKNIDLYINNMPYGKEERFCNTKIKGNYFINQDCWKEYYNIVQVYS